MWGAGPRITDIPFLPFRRHKLPNRERNVTIAHETDIFLTVDLRRPASPGRHLRGADDGPRNKDPITMSDQASHNLDGLDIDVSIYEIGEHEGQHYFSMGFVEKTL
jgi:hypothetical protein